MYDTHRKTRRDLVNMCVLEAEGQLNQGHFDKAEDTLYRGLVRAPGRADLLRKLSEVYRQSGRIDEARQCFRGFIPDTANHRFTHTGTAQPDSTAKSPATTLLPAWNPERRALTPPTYLGEVREFGMFKYASTYCLGSKTSRTQNGKIWFDGANTVVFDAGNQILPLHSKGNEVFVNFVARQRQPVHHQGRVCSLAGRSPFIYYHWMLDILPKLAVLEKSGIALDTIDTFLVRAKQPYQRETLALAGIPEDKIELSDGPFHSADELLVPYLKNDLGEKNYHGMGMGLASWIPAWLQQLQLAAPQDCPVEAKRLFISRKDAKTRSIENEAEFTELLATYGITAVTPGELTVSQQASLFEKAEIVIGLHGAGLTNIAFCRPGTRVVELFGNYKVPCYWALANLAGLEYANFICGDRIDQHRGGEISVDLQKFEQALQGLLN